MIENFESEFLAFCKAKPAAELFDCGNPAVCALGQFVARFGYRGGSQVYYRVAQETVVSETRYPLVVYNAVLGFGHESGGWVPDYYYSFGALVQRLEAAGVK